MITVGTLRADANGALAEGDYKRAAAEARASSIGNHARGNQEAEKEDLNTMGLAHLYEGDYAEATRDFQEALTLDRKLGDNMGAIVRLNNLGNVDFFRAKYLEASKRYADARALLDRNVHASWYGHLWARTLANQAVLLQRVGQYDAALPIYKVLSENLQGSERARMLSNKGTLLRRLGDPYLAIKAYEEAQALFQSHKDLDGEIGVLKNLGIALASDLREPERAIDVFDAALVRAMRTSNRREVLQIRLYRADALRRVGRFVDSRFEAEHALQLSRELKSNEDEWKALFLIGTVDHDRPLAFFKEAVRLIEVTRSELELSSLKRDFLADKREVYDAAIKLMLNGPADELFSMLERSRARALEMRFPAVSLQRIRQLLDSATILIETWSGGSQRAALVVSHDSARVVQWATPDLRSIPELTLESVHRVIIVPNGDLQEPFETLPLSDGRLLIEKVSVSYMPRAAMLASRQRPARWRFPWELNTLSLAVPDSGDGRPRLDHAVDEARDAAGSRRGSSRLLIGAAATGSILEKPDYPIVHVAAHAVSNPFSGEGSRLLLGSGPVYLSSVYAWDLRNVGLIVLSACETENAEFVRGEGAAGFSRALLYAGADSTITTMWPVADAPTAELMRSFYLKFRDGYSASEALRFAKLGFLYSNTPLKDVKLWGAFVLTGNASVTAPHYISWWSLAALSLLVIGLLGLYRLNR